MIAVGWLRVRFSSFCFRVFWYFSRFRALLTVFPLFWLLLSLLSPLWTLSTCLIWYGLRSQLYRFQAQYMSVSFSRNITTLPLCHIPLVRRRSRPEVFPFSSNWTQKFGTSFPSTISARNNMLVRPSAIVWYSLPKGWDLRGMKIHPGHVQRLIHIKTDSSRQHIHDGM